MWRRPWLLLAAAAVLAAAARAASSDGPKISDLKKLALVTSKNYEELMTGKCPVIFHLSQDDTFEGADELAKELEGLVRVAQINTETQADLIKEQSIPADGDEWLVKPYLGSELTAHGDLASARTAAEGSNPTDTVTVLKEQGDIQGYLAKAHGDVKVGLVLLHTKDEVPALLKKIALWMHDDFSFASFSNPPEEMVKQLGQDGHELPLLLAFVPQEDKEQTGRIQFAPAPYDKKKFGALKFRNLFKFGLVLRSELDRMGFYDRRDEPNYKQRKAQEEARGNSGGGGGAGSAPKTAPLFEYTADTPDACSESKLGLCVFGVIDGSPMNADWDKQLEVLRSVQASPSMKGRVLHFMWVDHSCHPSFGDAFGVTAANLPAVLAVSPKKQAWAQHVGAFEATKVGGFVGGVLTGRNRIAKLPESGLPAIPTSDNCTAAHEALMPPPAEEEEEVELDDIMAEIRAEAAEEQEEQAAAFKDLEADAADAEMAAKRERAAKEAARMAKVSNKSSRKKKKKKTKKKKNKKAGKAAGDL